MYIYQKRMEQGTRLPHHLELSCRSKRKLQASFKRNLRPCTTACTTYPRHLYLQTAHRFWSLPCKFSKPLSPIRAINYRSITRINSPSTHHGRVSRLSCDTHLLLTNMKPPARTHNPLRLRRNTRILLPRRRQALNRPHVSPA